MDQFYGFLKAQHMTLSKVRSEISEGLNSYRERYGDLAENLKRIRSFKKYDEDRDLQPLQILLLKK